MKFSRETALETAKGHFWRAGYEASNVKVLSAHLGITRSSFYNAFGSRKKLFCEVIDSYAADLTNSQLYVIPSDKDFKPEVVQVFKKLCKMRALDVQHRGCLLVNSIAELSSSEGETELSGHLDDLVKRSKAILANRIKVAIHAGEFYNDLDPNCLAMSLQNLSYGTNLMSKVVHDEKSLWESCALILKGLGFKDR
jgi:TetR/AcrR family transcriptional repressor of nem operon